MADTIFSYENVKNDKKIGNQWRNYILQKFSDVTNWPLLAQIVGDNNTAEIIDKLTPESFNTINKALGAPAIYDDRPIDTTPVRPPLMRKSAQQTPTYASAGIPRGGVVSPATMTKTSGVQPVQYDPSIRLNDDVQHVINLLKTYGYSQQVLDSFKQNIDKILANTKDNNRIDTANQYIDKFLGDKQDLRRLNPASGKPAPSQQPQKADNKNEPGKKPGMSDDEIDAFLKEELGGNTTVGGTQGTQTGNTGGAQAGNTGGTGTQGMKTGGTGSTGGMRAGNSGSTGGGYASSGVAKGGTKTIGYEYDPNPGNVSLAYAMRNAPEQERRTALINKWNQEHGRSGSTYATPGMSTGGTYATGEGIKDANGNVLTNPGGDWEYQYALRDPQYGLGMMGKMSDAQKNYLQAVSDSMGYKYNFTGATRFV